MKKRVSLIYYEDIELNLVSSTKIVKDIKKKGTQMYITHVRQTGTASSNEMSQNQKNLYAELKSHYLRNCTSQIHTQVEIAPRKKCTNKEMFKKNTVYRIQSRFNEINQVEEGATKHRKDWKEDM